MKIYLLIVLLFFVGCGPQHVKVDIKGTSLDNNTCLVDAATYKAAYDAQYQLKPYTFSRILIIRWKTAENGLNAHACTVYIINGKTPRDLKYDRLFVYDRINGSREVPMNLKDQPYLIAVYLYDMDRVKTASYLD